MKIAYVSDLHIDMFNGGVMRLPIKKYIEEEVDVILLLGDISNRATQTYNFLEMFLEELRSSCLVNSVAIPVVFFVPGNHEYYHEPMEIADSLFMELDRRYGERFYCLYGGRKAIHLGNYAFIGDTLWSDYLINGIGQQQYMMASANNAMSDFRRIWVDFYGGIRWNPVLAVRAHREALASIVDEVTEIRKMSSIKKIVMLSHMAPSWNSVHEEFRTGVYSSLNGAYTSAILDEGSVSYQPFLAENISYWFHGHMHNSLDYEVSGVRVLCNPRGYSLHSGRDENLEFDYIKVIEV